MTTPHKHAALIKQWADDPSQTVWTWVSADWYPCQGTIDWYTDSVYAVGPRPAEPPKKMCVLAGVKFPAPETEKPKLGANYFVADVRGGYYDCTWDDHPVDNKRLQSSTLHLTKEAAQAHANALLAATKQAIEAAK
jgi:hypothetical protein